MIADSRVGAAALNTVERKWETGFSKGKVGFPGPQCELGAPATAHTAPAFWVEGEPGLACSTWKLLEVRSLSSSAHYAQV